MSGSTFYEDRGAAQATSVRFTMAVDDDPQTTPRDFDCYDESEVTAWQDGAWQFVGVRAVADIRIPVGGGSFACYRLKSPGLWGVDYHGTADCDAYLESIYREEVEELRHALRAMPAALEAEGVA